MKLIKKTYVKLLISFVLIVLLAYFTINIGVSANELGKDASVSFKSGELTLENIPHINFKMNIPDPRRETRQPFGPLDGEFKVKDSRGSQTGWNISASLSVFEEIDTAETSLRGAYLRLLSAEIASETGSAASIVSYPIELIAGDGIFHKYIIAPPNTPNGIWAAKVPGGELVIRARSASLGSYKAKITWNLEDTP